MGDFSKELMKALNEAIEEVEFEIECPACEKEIEISMSQSGKLIKCPHCGQRIKFEKE